VGSETESYIRKQKQRTKKKGGNRRKTGQYEEQEGDDFIVPWAYSKHLHLKKNKREARNLKRNRWGLYLRICKSLAPSYWICMLLAHAPFIRHPQLLLMRIPAIRNSNFDWRGQLPMTVPPGGGGC
jgi:hypothetical protein